MSVADMISPVTIALKNIQKGIRDIMLPELSSSHARTQALAMLQALDMLMIFEEKLDGALSRQNADLCALMATVSNILEERNLDGEGDLSVLKNDIDDVHKNSCINCIKLQSNKSMLERNYEIKKVSARILSILSLSKYRSDPEFLDIRKRARAILSDRYGLDIKYSPVWVE